MNGVGDEGRQLTFVTPRFADGAFGRYGLGYD